MGFLDYLTEEIFEDKVLSEGQLSDEPPKKISRIIATLSGKDEFLFTFYSEHVLWEPQPGIGTCGVRPYGDGHHIVFAYDPEFFLNLPKAQVYFLLAHEIYHILRDHHDRASDKGIKSQFEHSMANNAMDTWINNDLHDEGTLGGFSMEPPFKIFGYRKEGDWGDVEEWVNKSVEATTGTAPDPPEKYDGPKLWEPLWDWIMEMFDKYGIKPQEDDGEPQENYPQPGMIIKGPDGSYGEVVEVDSVSKKVTKIEPITKEEAYARVKQGA